jgi:hypothetical protein
MCIQFVASPASEGTTNANLVDFGQRKEMNFIAKESLMDIFSYLDPLSLISAMHVCKHWYNLIKDKEEHLFQTYCERELGSQLLLGCKSWKRAYFTTCSKNRVNDVAMRIKWCKMDTVSIGEKTTVLPAAVFMNTTLSVLQVHSMPLLEVIPPAISRLQSLNTIHWYKTNTQTLPKELCTLPKYSILCSIVFNSLQFATIVLL